MFDYIIRKIKNAELGILEKMLYEAIFQPKGSEPLARDIIKTPEIFIYIENFFSKKDDHCFVSEIKGMVVGCVWVRILTGEIKGYGYIDSKTPEFAISLLPEYRKSGIGTALMKRMIDYLREYGYKQASLSVDKNNYACKMYKGLGFKIIEEKENDYLMLLQLNKE